MKPKQSSTQKSTPYYVLDKSQLQCLASAVRLDIVDHLAAYGVMAIKELATSIGKKPSAIYHHLKMLEEVGLIHEAGTRVVNRKSEKLYMTPSRRMRLSKALADEANAGVMNDIVSVLCRQTDRDFSRGADGASVRRSGPHQNLRFFRLVNRPSAAGIKEINAKLDEIAEILWREPDPERPMVALTWVMTPLDADSSDS